MSEFVAVPAKIVGNPDTGYEIIHLVGARFPTLRLASKDGWRREECDDFVIAELTGDRLVNVTAEDGSGLDWTSDDLRDYADANGWTHGCPFPTRRGREGARGDPRGRDVPLRSPGASSLQQGVHEQGLLHRLRRLLPIPGCPFPTRRTARRGGAVSDWWLLIPGLCVMGTFGIILASPGADDPDYPPALPGERADEEGQT